ncbi:MAG: phage DNA encapsidation protein, partial [Methanobrevibacter sp.]|nr:phage DNA encapsidation protein [Methanobrevibacter sp.]
MGKYYDGTKLLSMKDLNGKTPEIYMCTTNRTGGKTTYFARLCANRFFEKGEKFCLVYRYNYELDEVADKFYKDICKLFFSGTVMTSKRRASGIFHELFIDDISCGYAVSLNSADQLKKYSHLLSDTSRMFFDEFQSETNHYCNDEIKKLISVHTSIARGNGEQIRYVPIYMCANPVSIINPDYVELGISERLNDNTRFLRGDGFVLEQGY